MGLGEFDLIKVLGTGGFSKVLMGKRKISLCNIVRKKATGKLYAMKVISKKHILDADKVE